jgi:hypothetical protein
VRTASCPSLSMLGQHLANLSRSPHATSRRGKSKIESRRADSNRLPLLQLRVIIQALQGVARDCKCRISKPIPLLYLAECCTVLRSRWYQNGIRTSDSYSLRARPMVRTRDLPRATIHRPLFPGGAVGCNIGLSRPISLPAVAHRSCVLRAGWCSSGVIHQPLCIDDTGSIRLSFLTQRSMFSPKYSRRGQRVSAACLYLQGVGDGLIQGHHPALAPRLLPSFLSHACVHN